MAKTKIYLADLAHTQAVNDAAQTVPLGIGYIKAYAIAAFGSAVDITLFKHPEKFLAAIANEAPDIIGMTNYGWNENLNLQIGAYVRSKLPDALIVVGGPNIDPEADRRKTFLKRHSYADFTVVDGGEEPFAELIAWWQQGASDESLLPNNVVWLEGDTVRATRERKLTREITGVPSPYLDGYLDEFLDAGMCPLLETNRGCPFQCTFCAWGMASKDLVRRFSLETAMAEIAYVGARSQARKWIICDANFGLLKRDVELAHAIRAVKDKYGAPDFCQMWMAKNVTDRNLEIANILGDMVMPVMAVQSMNQEVLKEIKRDNISLETYRKYQELFHDAGAVTASDVIVPLPAETLGTHLEGLRELFDAGVDVILNHNMRLLAGAETNSEETRTKFEFKTRYRLIHGDAGAYRTPDGDEIRTFEVEESLRSTSTMSEQDLFFLRRLHFLVDFCWNIDVYKPLLKIAQGHGTNPLDVILSLLKETLSAPQTSAFWQEFESASQAEWFDTEDDIRAHFSLEPNFQKLIDQDFDKLNIKFSVRILETYKAAFDAAIIQAIQNSAETATEELNLFSPEVFSRFPSLSLECSEILVDSHVPLAGDRGPMRLVPAPRRQAFLDILRTQPNLSVSKLINVEGYRLQELGYVPAPTVEAA